jgi:hypothetical protein
LDAEVEKVATGVAGEADNAELCVKVQIYGDGVHVYFRVASRQESSVLSFL